MTVGTSTRAPRVTGSEPPKVPGYPVVGALPKLLRNELRFFVDAAQRCGEVGNFQIGSQQAYLINHPDYIKYVLQDNEGNYCKGNKGEALKVVAGEGLFTTDGEVWRRQRRMIQPAFHRQHGAAFAQVITDETGRMLERWERLAARGEPVEITKEMEHLSFAITVKTLFSTALDRDAVVISEAMHEVLAFLNSRVLAVLRIPLKVPTPQNRRFLAALGAIDAVVDRIIGERRASRREADDLLSLLLAARDDETGTGLSDAVLRDQVRTFLLAGYETTATALGWVWYVLSRNPSVERRLHAELEAALDGRAPTAADLAKLTYTRMVLDETMRLYPPAWIFTRDSIEADVIGGYPIPPKSMVLMSAYTMHRNPAYWDNPEGFDPERFAPDKATTRPRYAYFPFGGGPHLCVGNTFALLTMQLVVAMVEQAYTLHMVPWHPVEPYPRIVLQPRYGLKMTIHRRSGQRASAAQPAADQA